MRESLKKADFVQELKNELQIEKDKSIQAQAQIATAEALLKNKEMSLTGQLLALSGRARTSLDEVRKDIKEASSLEEKSLSLTDQIEANKTNDGKLDLADNEFKDLDKNSVRLDEADIVASSINEKMDNLNILGQVAVAFLILNYAILNCVISIVSIFFGNYLLTKYNIETKYPKLGKFIALRRKFQSYYLIFSISGIVIVCLIQIIFFIFVLTL